MSEAEYKELKAAVNGEYNARDAFAADNVFYVTKCARGEGISKYSKPRSADFG
jgi:hypothetical protein